MATYITPLEENATRNNEYDRYPEKKANTTLTFGGSGKRIANTRQDQSASSRYNENVA